jgi:hypothetical protein
MSLVAEQINRMKFNKRRLELKRQQLLEKQQRPVKISMRPFGGKLPSQGHIPWSPHGLDIAEERRRRAYYNKLIKDGYTPEQISGALIYEQAIKPPSKTPQAIGSFVGGLLAGQLIPGPVDEMAMTARFLRGTGKAVIAGAGGVVGKLAQILDDPDMEFNKRELAKVFGEETTYEGITLGLSPIGKRILRPIQKTVIEGAQEMSGRLASKGKQLGIKQPTRFLPAQFSENELIDTLQGIGEGGLIDPGVLTRYKKGQIVAAMSIIDDASDSISRGVKNMSPQEMANLLMDTIEDKGVSHSLVAKKLYGAVDVAIGDTKVSLIDTVAEAKKILERAEKARKIGMSGEANALLEKMVGSTDNIVSFETAQDIRSGLLDIVRKGSSKLAPDPKSVSIAQRLVSSIDDAMQQVAKDAGPEAYSKWRRANWFYKAGKERYHNKLINKLMRDLPDNPDAARAIFKNEENILRVKKAIGPAKFQDVKKAWFDSLISDSMLKSPADVTSVTGIGDPVGAKILKQFNGIGQPALDAAFTKAEQTNIREAARILATIQARTGGHSGALRFVQGTALASVVASPLYSDLPGGRAALAGSGVILIGPTVLSRMMTKPWFSRWLSEGYKAMPGTQQYVTFATRLVRNVFQERKNINRERLRRQKQSELRERMKRASSQRIPNLKELRGFGGRGF